MLKRSIILLITLTVSLSCQAQTCPTIDSFTIANPPIGWSIPMKPTLPDEIYHFTKAMHSLNESFYYKKVLCIYETSDAFLAPAFVLVSDKEFEEPSKPVENWDHPARVAGTVMCAPVDHDPSFCVFE